jgi:tripartite-type tricarboxylate transporter receptor subunit TctC
MKKTVALLLALTMLLALAACGNSSDGSASNNSASPAPSASTPAESGGEQSGGGDSAWTPSENISVIVPYSAGGTTDLSVRGVTGAVDTSALPSGVSVVVDNVVGGSGLVGITQFANSANDGSTVGIINCDFIMNMALGNTELSYEDFTPVGCVMNDGNLIFVAADAPYDTFEEFIEYANANGGCTISDAGAGSVQAVVTTAVANALGADLTSVHYDDAGAAVLGVVSGEVDAACCSSVTAAAQYEAGNIKPLATSSLERMSTFPDVPTMAECFPDELGDMDIPVWVFLAVRGDTDPAIVDYLSNMFNTAILTDDYAQVRDQFYLCDNNELYLEPDAAKDFWASQYEYYSQVVTLLDQ